MLITWDEIVRGLKRPSAVVLIIANLIPLLGVVALGWDVASVVVLYWFENVVIGLVYVGKMLLASPDGAGFIGALSPIGGERAQVLNTVLTASVGGDARKLETFHHVIKIFIIPFFVFHYFAFCGGHGVFVFAMFETEYGTGKVGFGFLSVMTQALRLFDTPLAWAAAALVVSHLFSFGANYLARGEYKAFPAPMLMFAPYGRVVVLHIAILIGGFAVLALDSPKWMIVVLIGGKVMLDLALHAREHERRAARA